MSRSKQPLATLDLTKRDHRVALFCLIAACLVLLIQSTFLIRTRWVEDESWLSNGSWTLAQEGRVRMPIFPSDPRYQADVSMPVYHAGVAAFFTAFGLGIPQARIGSALAAIATVIVVFLVAFDIGGPRCSVFSTLLLATDTFLVIAARTARPEAYTVLFCWLALLLYSRAARASSAKLALVSGLVLGIACINHPLSLPFVLSIGAFLLVRFRWRLWREPMVWSFAIGLALPAIPYVLWCFSDANHIASFRNVYLAKTADPLTERLIGEWSRWADFIGLGSQRVSIGIRLPLRLHIALLLIAAFWYLARTRRDLAGPAATVFILNILWWVYLVNKGPRYLVVLAPLFALLLGWVLAQSPRRPWRTVALAGFALVMVTQVGANAYWIYQSRHADYPALAKKLRQIIPANASAYGATTFWLALHDRTYYAYDRTKWDFTRRNLKPEYLILNDRVMAHGSGHGDDDFSTLRSQLTTFVRQHGTLAGFVPGDFYGDLEVYRVSY